MVIYLYNGDIAVIEWCFIKFAWILNGILYGFLKVIYTVLIFNGDLMVIYIAVI